MKKQVVIIHGGDAHNSREEYIRSLKREKPGKEDFLPQEAGGWKDVMQARLGDDYEVFLPEMPNWMSSKYEEWEIWFEKILPFLHDGPVFIGHSLGGIFLTTYFAKNADKKKARGVFLVAAPYRDPSSKDKLADFGLPKDISKLEKLGDKLHFYASEDDPVVDISAFKKYQKALPAALTTVFKDKNHFRLDEFPEMVRDLQEAFAAE